MYKKYTPSERIKMQNKFNHVRYLLVTINRIVTIYRFVLELDELLTMMTAVNDETEKLHISLLSPSAEMMQS